MEFIRSRRSAPAIDMAPLVDVVFQLLIFFILTSSYLNPAIKLNLPTAVTQDTQLRERIIVTIDKNGGVFINNNAVPMENLREEIQNKLSFVQKKSIDLQGDSDVPYRYFVRVMDEARQAGCAQINIVHGGEGKP